MAATLAEQLGYRPDDRLVILHADDIGLCSGSNQAFSRTQPSRDGALWLGDGAVPCGASFLGSVGRVAGLGCGGASHAHSRVVDDALGSADHAAPESGLVDPMGDLWPTVRELQATVKPQAAGAELRAQIAMVKAAGAAITHLDTHMTACIIPDLVDLYADLGRRRTSRFSPCRAKTHLCAVPDGSTISRTINNCVTRMAELGLPIVDYSRVTPCYSGVGVDAPSAAVYEQILGELEPGITFFALHPNAPGEIEQIDLINHAWRIFEYEYFQSDRLDTFLRREGIVPIGFRAICDVMRAGLAPLDSASTNLP